MDLDISKLIEDFIDTTTPAGRMMLAFAEFERAMLRERTKGGARVGSARGADRRKATEALGAAAV